MWKVMDELEKFAAIAKVARPIAITAAVAGACYASYQFGFRNGIYGLAVGMQKHFPKEYEVICKGVSQLS